jgi:hypothetical protein
MQPRGPDARRRSERTSSESLERRRFVPASVAQRQRRELMPLTASLCLTSTVCKAHRVQVFGGPSVSVPNGVVGAAGSRSAALVDDDAHFPVHSERLPDFGPDARMSSRAGASCASRETTASRPSESGDVSWVGRSLVATASGSAWRGLPSMRAVECFRAPAGGLARGPRGARIRR